MTKFKRTQSLQVTNQVAISALSARTITANNYRQIQLYQSCKSYVYRNYTSWSTLLPSARQCDPYRLSMQLARCSHKGSTIHNTSTAGRFPRLVDVPQYILFTLPFSCNRLNFLYNLRFNLFSLRNCFDGLCKKFGCRLIVLYWKIVSQEVYLALLMHLCNSVRGSSGPSVCQFIDLSVTQP